MSAGSRIDLVTVYREGARVRRTATVQGERSVRFTGLPLTVEDGSVRARVLTKDGPVAIDVRVTLDVPTAQSDLTDAEDAALKAAKAELDRCKLEVGRLENALVRVEALKLAPRPQPREGEPPLAIPLESRAQLIALRTQESERLAKEIADARGATRRAERRFTEEADRTKRASSARKARVHELRKEIVVNLDRAPIEPSDVAIEYIVPGARWSPAYALVLQGPNAHLTMRALVAQRTGEDWRGARLVLSTADPDRWVELPELAKARIGRTQPTPTKRGYRAPPEGADALYADYDRVSGGTSQPPQAAYETKKEEEEENTDPVIEHLSLQGFGGAAPQRPPSPPMLAAPMAAMSQTRSAPGTAGVVKDMVAALVPRQLRSAAPTTLVLEEEPTAVRVPDEETTPSGPTYESAAYGQLRMRGPDDRQRGELIAITTAQAYVEQAGDRLAVGVSVSAILAIAFEGATIDVERLPPGHAFAASDDVYDYAYEADLPVDIPSDGAFHGVVVATYDTDATMRYVAVPREGQQVFRVLDLESPESGALLSGPLDVYEARDQDGDLTYRMTTRVPPTPPRATVEIGLGAEPAIKIARTTTFQEDAAGLLGGSLALGHHISVELRNLLPRAVTVEVRERVPVVRKDDAEVKVDVGSVEPPWERWDQDQTIRGGYVWKMPLEAGQARTLSARYTIRISAKQELVGGNRRES